MAKRKVATGGRARVAPRRVFISHSSEDIWIADAIRERIERLGATSFLDERDIRGGEDILERISEEMRASDELLLLWSPKAIGREWISLEIGAAAGLGISIVVFLLHTDVEQIPSALKKFKAYRLSLNDFESYCRELTRRLGEGR